MCRHGVAKHLHKVEKYKNTYIWVDIIKSDNVRTSYVDAHFFFIVGHHIKGTRDT